MMQEHHLPIIWKILSEYIPSRDHESAAHHLINELIDAGIEEDVLWQMCKGNASFARVVNELIGEDDTLDPDEDEI